MQGKSWDNKFQKEIEQVQIIARKISLEEIPGKRKTDLMTDHMP